MDARSVLTRLRDKHTLTQDEITWFANGLATGAVTDAQAGAFAMGALLNGLTEPEKVMLTLAMRDSGDVLKWDMPGPVVDKHSTGGV
ncbi:MAG: thymidine phosphorylase, partial [Marinosulfonomonas sp.]|nr:thymidine phosphorylase [Marinosulfonomonas sp.]